MRLMLLEYQNKKHTIARKGYSNEHHVPDNDEDLRFKLLEYQRFNLRPKLTRDFLSEEEAMLKMRMSHEERTRYTESQDAGDSRQGYYMQAMQLQGESQKRLDYARQSTGYSDYPMPEDSRTQLLYRPDQDSAMDDGQTHSQPSGVHSGQEGSIPSCEERQSPATPLNTTNSVPLQDYQIHLMLLEQQNDEKRRRILQQPAPRPQRPVYNADPNSTASPHLSKQQILHSPWSDQPDFHDSNQGQLHLLKTKNDKRLAMQKAEEEQEKLANEVQPTLSAEDKQKSLQEQLSLLEQQNNQRLAAYRASRESIPHADDTSSSSHDHSQPESWREQNQAFYCSLEPQPTQTEDKWGKGPFPAGQGVLQGYRNALDRERAKEAAKTGSQTSVEFSEERQRYHADLLSARNLPVTPGTSCAPPAVPESTDQEESSGASGSKVRGVERPLAHRPANAGEKGFDELYDS